MAANEAPDRAVHLDEGIVGPDSLIEVYRPGVEGVIERLERRTRSPDAGHGSIGQQVLLAAHDYPAQLGCH